MNNKVNYIKYILSALPSLIFVVAFNFISFAYTCKVEPGEPGCCTSCPGYFRSCYTEEDLPNRCPVPEGYCDCLSHVWCNSTPYGECMTPTNPAKEGDWYYCDRCCCTLSGDPGGPDPGYIWRGIKGYVWSDFNNDGILNSVTSPDHRQYYHEDYRGDPYLWGDDDDSLNYTPYNDFSVIVSGSGIDNPEDFARRWTPTGTARIGGRKSIYFSHCYGVYGDCTDSNGGMRRNGSYIATLGNLPSGSTCGEFVVKNPDGSEQGRGTGCEAPFIMTASNGYIDINWKLVSACTPNSGTLSAWGQCQANGKQYRTCDGATCCPSGCTPGSPGCTCGNCNGAPLERPCLRLEGIIWSDDNSNGNRDLNEIWKGTTGLLCSTNKVHTDFSMSITEESGNQIGGWWCHNTYGAYYKTPEPNPVEPEVTKSVTLSSIPIGYKFVSWQYITQASGGSVVKEGSGSSATNLLMPSSGWVNVHWKLAQEKYNLKLKVREIPPEESAETSLCGSSKFNTFDVMPGASVTIKNSTGSTTLCSGTSNSEGDFTCPIWTYQGEVLIEVSKDVGGDVPETYTMQCPAVNQYSFEPEPPSPPSDGATINLNIGLQTIYKKGWVSAIDADVFANELNVTVPDGPTNNSFPGQIYQGFAKTLVNSSFNNDNYLGFIFSQSDNRSNPDIERGCPSKKGFETNIPCDKEYGGYAYDLKNFNQEHKSIWLENFDFSPPSSAKTLNDNLPNTFVAGGVYQISSDIFNERLGSGSDYSYTITSSGGEGIAILYVNGNSEINVNIKTTNPSKGRLLLVINGSLTIGSNVGTNITSFQMSGNPNIMAGIIAKDQITFQSKGEISSSNFDKPVMVSAPLVSRAGISFKRDLYHDNNAVIPAESAKFFGKYLYYISNLEREKSSSHLYYTGVSTYDLDWEYIY